MSKNTNLLIILAFVFTYSCSSSKKVTTTQGYTALFNGKDIDDWKIKIAGYPLGQNFGNTFRIEDKILKIRYDKYGQFENRFGGLYYKRPFNDYRLKVEYRFVGETCPGAPDWGYRDSGIQFHSQSPESMALDQTFPICLEYNLHGGNGTDDRPVGEICANGMNVMVNGAKNASYCTPANVKKTFHGDQWVTLEIDVRNDQYTYYTNGEKILSFSDPKYDNANETSKKLMVDGNDDITSGYISLQSNSHPIDFRKIEIMEYK